MKNKSIQIPEKFANKVYMIRLWKYGFEHDLRKFQDQWPLDIVAGGFVSFDSSLIDNFSKLYYSLIDEALNIDIIDDDQYFMTMLFVRFPELFLLEDGNWVDGARFAVHHE